MLSENSHTLFKQILQDRKPHLETVKVEAELPENGDFAEDELEVSEERINTLEKTPCQAAKKENCRKWQATICKVCSLCFTSKRNSWLMQD